MDGNTTVKYLQHYLRQKDLGFLALDSLPPGPQREAQEERLKHNFFLKLVEEVGEVSRAIFHGQFRGPGEHFGRGAVGRALLHPLPGGGLRHRHGGGHPGEGAAEQPPLSRRAPL